MHVHKVCVCVCVCGFYLGHESASVGVSVVGISNFFKLVSNLFLAAMRAELDMVYMYV